MTAETITTTVHGRWRDEAGFTLPEAVVSLTVLAVVLALLTGGLVASRRPRGSTTRRLPESTRAQIYL